MLKIFEEERELTVMLLMDVSGSGNFGTTVTYKKDIMTEVAAVLSFLQFLIMIRSVSFSFPIRWKNSFLR